MIRLTDFSGKEEAQVPSLITALHHSSIMIFSDDDLSLEIRHDLLLLFLRRFRVDIHRRLDILMTHHALDHLQVRLVFAKPCAKGMPQIVGREVRDH